MDSYLDLATADTAMPGVSTHVRVLEIAPAACASWRIAMPAQARPAAVNGGHRKTQIKFAPRMGPPTCSPPV